VVAQQVLLKKDEKVRNTLHHLNEGFTDDDFVCKFQELYPDDWGKIVTRYTEHEKTTRPGKPHPMPEPHKYLLNISHKQRQEFRNNE